MNDNPEIGKFILAAGRKTNYHDHGCGRSVLLIHGSGPGVSAWANWRTVLPALSEELRIIAPDMAGFGFTERRTGEQYNLDLWVEHVGGLLDALDLTKVHVVGNSFGGALATALAIRHPDRVDRLVLMGSVGLRFDITPGLDAVWGYEASVENMRELIRLFAYDESLASDELAELRYKASIRPGVQEAYASMFPAPRQRWVDAMASPEPDIAELQHETLILHGRDDRIIPAECSVRYSRLIKRSDLHIFGQCGHWVQIEKADAFNRIVGAFLLQGLE